MTTAPRDPLIGQTLDGRYTIVSRIARGGMAMVYLADDLRLQRRVAVKVMHEHLSEDESFAKRFDTEARSAAQLAHPNLVNVFDQGEDLGRPYLVMEYLPSITLRELLKQRKSLTLDEALEIAEAVLAGLAAAHIAGIVHRDVKPENVMLLDDGRIKIGDFGLARAVSANTTTGQALLGTIAYLSPELVTRGVADERSDLYAFGIMLFEMLTGQQPYSGDQPMQIAYQHAHSDVPVPSTLSPVSPPAVDEFVRWLTRRPADDRPADAGVALEVLRDIRANPYQDLHQLAPAGTPPADPASAATTVLPDSVTVAPSAASQAPRTVSETSPLEQVQRSAARRRKRGRWIALLTLIAMLLTGGLTYWFSQGPGATVSIPDVSGQEPAAARAALEDVTLNVTMIDCPSLEVDSGLATVTTPEAGTRVERESMVELCVSTGPEWIETPTLAGLTEDEARAAIESAGFTPGAVADRRFDEVETGRVLAALTEDDELLGDTYPERGVIHLVLSVGPLPNVVGERAEDARKTLEAAGLVVSSELSSDAYSDSTPEGHVIEFITSDAPVRPGDAVGIVVSLGPELFEVPDVAGMNVNEAVQVLRDSGFEVDSGIVPEGAAGDLFEVKRTDPAAGSEHPAGTTVALKYI